MIPNAENAEVGDGILESQLVRTWQYETFQMYYYNEREPSGGGTSSNRDMLWRISKINPHRYFYKGTGDRNSVRDWIYHASERGGKPDPIVSCKKGTSFIASL
jgi:hypothetical protein